MRVLVKEGDRHTVWIAPDEAENLVRSLDIALIDISDSREREAYTLVIDALRHLELNGGGLLSVEPRDG